MRLLVRKMRYITHISLPKCRSQYFIHVFLKSHTHFQIEKEQKDKQRSTKHTHKTKDRVTRTPLKTG
jgi:bacterioferritin (cytochrome b1)